MAEETVQPGVKLLIVGQESAGKTTLISSIKDALVMSTDNKAFRGKVPHFRYSTYNGLDDLIATLEDKLERYKEKMDTYPKTVVIDSVTHLATAMEKWANDKFTGFNIYSNLGKDTLAFNAYLEDVLIPNGINVILTAHTQYDAETARYIISAPGSFGKNGSWLSVVDESRFLEVKSGKRIVHYRTSKFPCRTLNTKYPDSMPVTDYGINSDIEELSKLNTEAEEWSLD